MKMKIGKHRSLFLALALVLITVIIVRGDERTAPLARAFGRAFFLVFGVLLLLVAVFSVAWIFHKKKRDAAFHDAIDPKNDTNDVR